MFSNKLGNSVGVDKLNWAASLVSTLCAKVYVFIFSGVYPTYSKYWDIICPSFYLTHSAPARIWGQRGAM